MIGSGGIALRSVRSVNHGLTSLSESKVHASHGNARFHAKRSCSRRPACRRARRPGASSPCRRRQRARRRLLRRAPAPAPGLQREPLRRFSSTMPPALSMPRASAVAGPTARSVIFIVSGASSCAESMMRPPREVTASVASRSPNSAVSRFCADPRTSRNDGATSKSSVTPAAAAPDVKPCASRVSTLRGSHQPSGCSGARGAKLAFVR